MAELGIDISQQASKTLDCFLSKPFDEVITVCDQANEACPFFPQAGNRRHWSITDPATVTGGGSGRRRMHPGRPAYLGAGAIAAGADPVITGARTATARAGFGCTHVIAHLLYLLFGW